MTPETVSGPRHPGPCGAGVAAAHVQRGRDQLPATPGQRDGADFVAVAVQADLAGAGGDRLAYYSAPLQLHSRPVRANGHGLVDAHDPARVMSTCALSAIELPAGTLTLVTFAACGML